MVFPHAHLATTYLQGFGDQGKNEEAQSLMWQKRGRNWFVLSSFAVGAMVPLAIMTLSWVAGTPNAGGNTDDHTTTAQWAFLWLIWPTWILMLDAEHTGTIVFMLALASALNGLWYAAVAIVFWYIGAGLNRLARSIVSLC